MLQIHPELLLRRLIEVKSVVAVVLLVVVLVVVAAAAFVFVLCAHTHEQAHTRTSSYVRKAKLQAYLRRGKQVKADEHFDNFHRNGIFFP